MSVTYRLHQYDDSMNDKTLKSIGILGGPLSQLTSSVSLEEETQLLENADSQEVGYSLYEFPTRVNKLFDGIETIDEKLIMAVEVAASETDTSGGRFNAEAVVEWIKEREGEKAFMTAG